MRKICSNFLNFLQASYPLFILAGAIAVWAGMKQDHSPGRAALIYETHPILIEKDSSDASAEVDVYVSPLFLN